MKAVLAIVMLAVGLVIGVTSGMFLKAPEAVTPTVLLPGGTPDRCLEAVESAEELERLTGDYLSLIRDSYVPLLERYTRSESVDPGTGEPQERPTGQPIVQDLLAADHKLADLSDRTRKATGRFNEAAGVCRSQSGDSRRLASAPAHPAGGEGRTSRSAR